MGAAIWKYNGQERDKNVMEDAQKVTRYTIDINSLSYC